MQRDAPRFLERPGAAVERGERRVATASVSNHDQLPIAMVAGEAKSDGECAKVSCFSWGVRSVPAGFGTAAVGRGGGPICGWVRLRESERSEKGMSARRGGDGDEVRARLGGRPRSDNIGLGGSHASILLPRLLTSFLHL